MQFAARTTEYHALESFNPGHLHSASFLKLATDPAPRAPATLLKPHDHSQNFRLSGSLDSSTFHLPPQQQQQQQQGVSSYSPAPAGAGAGGRPSSSLIFPMEVGLVERASSVGLPDSLFAGSYASSSASEADSAEFNNQGFEWNAPHMASPPGPFTSAQQQHASPAAMSLMAAAAAASQTNPHAGFRRPQTPEGFPSGSVRLHASHTPPLPSTRGQNPGKPGFPTPQQHHSGNTTSSATAAHNSFRVASPALTVGLHQQQVQQHACSQHAFGNPTTPSIATPPPGHKQQQQQQPTTTETPTPGAPVATPAGLAPHVQKLRERLPWFGLGKADTLEKTVVILRGIPGTGKSSFANSLRYFYEDPVTHQVAPVTPVICSADHFFTDAVSGVYKFDKTRLGDAHRASRSRFMHGLREQLPLLVIDNTNCAKWEYQQYIDWSREAGYQVVLVEFVCREEEVAWRCQQRARFPVPMPVVRAMMRRWEHDERAILLPPAGLDVGASSSSSSTAAPVVVQQQPQQQQRQPLVQVAPTRMPSQLQQQQLRLQLQQQEMAQQQRSNYEFAAMSRQREDQLARIEQQLAFLRQQQHFAHQQREHQLQQQMQQQQQLQHMQQQQHGVPMVHVSRSSPVSPHAGMMTRQLHHQQQLLRQQQHQQHGDADASSSSSSGAHTQGLHFTFPPAVRGPTAASDASIWRD